MKAIAKQVTKFNNFLQAVGFTSSELDIKVKESENRLEFDAYTDYLKLRFNVAYLCYGSRACFILPNGKPIQGRIDDNKFIAKMATFVKGYDVICKIQEGLHKLDAEMVASALA